MVMSLFNQGLGGDLCSGGRRQGVGAMRSVLLGTKVMGKRRIMVTSFFIQRLCGEITSVGRRLGMGNIYFRMEVPRLFIMLGMRRIMVKKFSIEGLG